MAEDTKPNPIYIQPDTQEERDTIFKAAKMDKRTVSAFLLSAGLRAARELVRQKETNSLVAEVAE